MTLCLILPAAEQVLFQKKTKNKLFIDATVRTKRSLTSFESRCSHEGTYLVDIYWLLFGLYGFYLDVLAELYCLLLCFHCRFPRNNNAAAKQCNSRNQF